MATAGGSKSETSKQGTLTWFQKDLLEKLYNQVAPQVGQGAETYGGQIAPDASALQQQGFDALSSMFSGESGAALSQMLSGDSAFQIDPAARQQVYDSEKAMAMRQFQSETMPMLEERYNAMGAGRSGGLQHAGAQAGADLSLGLGSLYSQLGYQDEQARRMGLESAAQRQGQGLSLWGQGVGQQLAGGQMQRNIQGEQLGEGYNQWLASQPYSNPWLTSFAPTVLGTQAFTPVTETTSWGSSAMG
jgi:hypothetical protein